MLLNNEAKLPVSPDESVWAGYHKISAGEAKSMMEGGSPYVLMDVRTEEEFKEKRIAGAILMPVDEVGKRAEKELPDKEEVVLIYCFSGRKSADAAREMVKKGYVHVYDFGGIQDWPYETVTGM